MRLARRVSGSDFLSHRSLCEELIPCAQLPLKNGALDRSATSREKEISALAANQSSQEIAVRLGISAGTVENHLSKVMKKSGTSSRDQLRAFVVQSLRGQQIPRQ
ncbi:helix-turn-helix transcriptional regulator [Pseudarthrobacter sp. GA104]|uniref:helix-turn-helix domain-containing protein n=1 Tax=Pseudarthrobacter sp. GA104 TaxID=2676311 RepID=UPI003519EB21